MSRSNLRMPLVPQRERVLVQRLFEEGAEQEDALLVGRPRVQFASSRRLVANQQAIEFLLAFGAEGDLDARRFEAEALQVGRVLVDDALDADVREAAGD